QTRTVASSAPSGCSGGSPVLTQACTPPADGAALYAQKCAGCHGSLANSNLKGKHISVTSINSRNMAQGLTDAQLQAIVDAVGP
ncbi:MAG TPA: cytochrome c, partial [Anaeromyxobacter sp.]